MRFTALEISGADAVRILHEYRTRYAASGEYPFLIGGAEELEGLEQTAESSEQPTEILEGSLDVVPSAWIARRRKEIEGEDWFSPEELLGEWPGEIAEKGSIGIHRDILSGAVKSRVYLGLARIDKPWHLPAILPFGGWNECPDPEVQCAFHRRWQERYGAEIVGVSGDVVECVVARPPLDREAAVALAWEQYWYCSDIVEQGCGTVSNLAATLLNSSYWYFWWD